jgi:hypothetical protein
MGMVFQRSRMALSLGSLGPTRSDSHTPWNHQSAAGASDQAHTWPRADFADNQEMRESCGIVEDRVSWAPLANLTSVTGYEQFMTVRSYPEAQLWVRLIKIK